MSYVANVREYFRKLGYNLNLYTVINKYFDILIWKLCQWTLDLGHFVLYLNPNLELISVTSDLSIVNS